MENKRPIPEDDREKQEEDSGKTITTIIGAVVVLCMFGLLLWKVKNMLL